MSEAVIRAFRDEDLEAVLELRARVFGADDLERERTRWRWEFDQNPFLVPGIPPAWVAELGGTLVGVYAMLPQRVRADGLELTALCGMDFCVDEAHRHLGLGFQLTSAFVKTAGSDFSFVTSPTPAAAALMRYHGASILGAPEGPCLWVWTPASSAEQTGPAVELELLEGFDERFDTLFERVARHHRLLGLRDRRHLDWRYRDYPFAQPEMIAARAPGGELLAFAVVQLDASQDRAYLMELFGEPGEGVAFGALLARAIELARGAGIAELYAFHRLPEAHAALERAGFGPVAEHPLLPLCIPPGRNIGLKDWYLTAGDGDFLFGVGS